MHIAIVAEYYRPIAIHQPRHVPVAVVEVEDLVTVHITGNQVDPNMCMLTPN